MTANSISDRIQNLVSHPCVWFLSSPVDARPSPQWLFCQKNVLKTCSMFGSLIQFLSVAWCMTIFHPTSSEALKLLYNWSDDDCVLFSPTPPTVILVIRSIFWLMAVHFVPDKQKIHHTCEKGSLWNQIVRTKKKHCGRLSSRTGEITVRGVFKLDDFSCPAHLVSWQLYEFHQFHWEGNLWTPCTVHWWTRIMNNAFFCVREVPKKILSFSCVNSVVFSVRQFSFLPVSIYFLSCLSHLCKNRNFTFVFLFLFVGCTQEEAFWKHFVIVCSPVAGFHFGHNFLFVQHLIFARMSFEDVLLFLSLVLLRL